MDTKSEEQRAIDRPVPAEVRERAEINSSSTWDDGPHLLFVAGLALRGLLALLVIGCAVYVFNLVHTWSAAVLVVGLASASLAWILLDDAFDIEAVLAREAALAATFEPDPFGTRAAAVRAFSDEFVHAHGRAPYGPATLKQPGTDVSFRAQFAPTGRSTNWYAKVLLVSLQLGLRVVAVGLLAVIAAQLYTVLVG